jgi:hypothetical protein
MADAGTEITVGVTIQAGAEVPGEDGAAGEDGTSAEIVIYALSKNPLDISVTQRVILRTQSRPQPHDPPAHAERLQKCRQLALHRLFVEFAGIDARCREAIEVSQRHAE